MDIHELINDDLSIHYLIHCDVEDMKALQVAARYAANAIEAAETPTGGKAALLATLLAHYPITTYEEKMAAIPKPPLPTDD